MRALAARERTSAAALLGLVVLIYLWPALVQGHPLAPIALLWELYPWKAAAPADAARYVNLELGDVVLSYYPWDVLARELLHAGTFPAWNPYAFAGTPFYANLEVAWLSPFSLPLWILPLNYALGVAAALKLWVAGFGNYLLVRELRLGFWPGILAGISYALCAFDIMWLSHGVHVSVAVLLPWSIWLVERIMHRGRPGDGLALTAVIAVALSGGHPGTQLHLLAATVLYALARAATSRDLAPRDLVRRLGLVAGGVLLGGLLMAIVLLPGARAAAGTVGALGRERGGNGGFIGAHMTFDALRTAAFPDWWGRPSEGIFLGPANYRERTFYAGSLALLLASFGLVARGRWRSKGIFAGLGLVGAAIAVRCPLLYDAVVNAPLFDRVQNQRILLWTLFAVSVLSAFGLQALLDRPRSQRRSWAVIAAGLLLAVLAIWSVPFEGQTIGSALGRMLHRIPDAEPLDEVLALASVGWWLAFVAAAAIVLLTVRRFPRRPWVVGLLVAVVAAADMLHFAHGYQPMGPTDKLLPPRTPAVAFLQRHAADGRIAGSNFVLPNDWSTTYHLRDARGYDAPQPSVRFARLWRMIEPRQQLSTSFRITDVSSLTLRVLGLLGVRYLVVNPEAETDDPHLSRAYTGPDAAIYANDLAMPRAMVAARVLVAADDDEELRSITGAFDPRQDVVVRRDELPAGAAPARGAGGVVRLTHEANARVALRASLPRDGVVVLDDAWAPGWTVTVDGHPARALQADVVLRGVSVPAGTHTIVWSYRVPGLRLGALLSGVGVAIVASWTGWLLLGRRRRRRPRAAS